MVAVRQASQYARRISTTVFKGHDSKRPCWSYTKQMSMRRRVRVFHRQFGGQGFRRHQQQQQQGPQQPANPISQLLQFLPILLLLLWTFMQMPSAPVSHEIVSCAATLNTPVLWALVKVRMSNPFACLLHC